MPAASIHDFEAGQVWGAALGDRTRRTRRIVDTTRDGVGYCLLEPPDPSVRWVTRESMAWWVRYCCAVLQKAAEKGPTQ